MNMAPIEFLPLTTRADLARAAAGMTSALTGRLSPCRAELRLRGAGAAYPERTSWMEGFSRVLWALVPMLKGGCPEAEEPWALWRQGIGAGTDPGSPEYWGDIGPYDQRMVEMAVMGLGMGMAPDRFFFALGERESEQMRKWLDQINRFDMPANNWRFFRVLVNCGFRLCGLPCDRERLDEDLRLIDSHYEGGGWYWDYPSQRDYYVSWAFHFYGLIYSVLMRDLEPGRCAEYRRRARAFAPKFACWFAADGAGIPFGRSLTYRFAQGAFFAAMAFAGETAPGLGMGEMKALLLGNLRGWLDKPIFLGDGTLSVGYDYPNLHMAEGYNAPGSPYWAFKSFLPLALPEGHPFWQAEEKSFEAPPLFRDPSARMLIARDPSGRHVQAFPVGQHAPEHKHGAAKYEKFAYSTLFGFSVPVDTVGLARFAPDSMLAFSEDGLRWSARFGQEAFSLSDEAVESVWKPYPGVTVRTRIRPVGEWQLRAHEITSDRELQIAEGAYALPRDGTASLAGQGTAWAEAPAGFSGIAALEGYEGAEILLPEPNTSLVFPRTVLPLLRGRIGTGRTLLRCAVLGTGRDGPRKWKLMPKEADGHDMG